MSALRTGFRLLAALLSPAAVAAPAEAMGAAQLARAALSLGLVLALIVLCAWLLRRFGGPRLRPSQRLQVLASVPLGQRERLALVDVDGQRLLIGVAPGRVDLLRDCGAGEQSR